ncbi:hypothetical protein ACHAXR_008717 [Thalassiosira sp. AJA248-18]
MKKFCGKNQKNKIPASTMRTPSSFLSLHQVTYTAIPILLLASLSLSPAWAGAFNSGISSPIIKHNTSTASRGSGAPSVVRSVVDGSTTFLMKSLSPTITTTTRDPASSPSFLSLSTLLFLRGGQQDEDTTVTTSDETASLDADSTVNMNLRYGTQQDEESSNSGAAAVEMTESHPVDVQSTDETVVVTKKEAAPSSSSSVVSSPLLSIMAPASSLLKTAATFYTQQLSLRPIITKSLTAGIIFGLSDWCAQLVERRGSSSISGGEKEESELFLIPQKSPIVFSRILATFLVGLLFFGPAANAWYSMIFKLLPSTSLISTLQKAALGQIIFGPTFTCVFFAAGMIQSGTFTLGAWLDKVKSDLPAVWASGLGFWPAVDFISYKVVPVQWIPLFVNFCSFVWTIYLSLVANRGESVEG